MFSLEGVSLEHVSSAPCFKSESGEFRFKDMIFLAWVKEGCVQCRVSFPKVPEVAGGVVELEYAVFLNGVRIDSDGDETVRQACNRVMEGYCIECSEENNAFKQLGIERIEVRRSAA